MVLLLGKEEVALWTDDVPVIEDNGDDIGGRGGGRGGCLVVLVESAVVTGRR